MRDWEKLARACRRYLDAYNDEIADDTVLGSVGNDLRIIAIREVLPSGVDPIRLALERRMAAYLESELGPEATFEAKVDELLNSYGALLRKIDGEATS